MNLSHFSSLSGAKILITGHTGFKGSWLSAICRLIGMEAYGVSNAVLDHPSHHSLLDSHLKPQHESFFDINDCNKLVDCLDRFSPDFVVHLAAQPIVKYSYEHPLETFNTNSLGTVSVLESVRRSKSFPSCLFITSDKCYENKEWVWGYRESDELGGQDPYSASKAMAEIAISSYARSFPKDFQNLSSARAGNVIGGGDFAIDRIVPDVIKSIINSSPLSVRNPHSIRPWQHVLEPLSGYLTILSAFSNRNLVDFEAFNFAPTSLHYKSVKELLDELQINMPELIWTDESTLYTGPYEWNTKAQ